MLFGVDPLLLWRRFVRGKRKKDHKNLVPSLSEELLSDPALVQSAAAIQR